jgi:lysophospholipase L1-like esterase
VGGGSIPGLLEVAALAVRRYEPKLVTLMIGTNDVALDLELPTLPKRLEALVEAITGTDPKLVLAVATIPPSLDPVHEARGSIYRVVLEDLVKRGRARGERVSWVDVHAAFGADASSHARLLADRAHPNDAGYVRIASAWYRALAPILEQRSEPDSAVAHGRL